MVRTTMMTVRDDDNNGYHLDKYDDVEELPFRLDNGNLRKVTG